MNAMEFKTLFNNTSDDKINFHPLPKKSTGEHSLVRVLVGFVSPQNTSNNPFVGNARKTKKKKKVFRDS